MGHFIWLTTAVVIFTCNAIAQEFAISYKEVSGLSNNETINLLDDECGEGSYQGENGVCELCKDYLFFCRESKECCKVDYLKCDDIFLICRCQDGMVWDIFQEACVMEPTWPTIIEEAVAWWILAIVLPVGVLLIVLSIGGVIIFVVLRKRRRSKIANAGRVIGPANTTIPLPSAPMGDNVWSQTSPYINYTQPQTNVAPPQSTATNLLYPNLAQNNEVTDHNISGNNFPPPYDAVVKIK
ncbi:uncharacterized protein LOC132202435 isoform X2 [Neocloeon triangulifer]|uniref:uncharacterized protein LOC132202435 isoform X2 n=1 Tax=Neocloeon triangulifer TaxID=2078957 RepID=UPI00286F35F8|nr:uncharacterized protein LOC132202435 isoform X2 [Neocloeon triangulifer]